jgi:O-antigen chain-terminating methyltransferase
VADPQTIEDLVARLERERAAADRAYNDALTAVDRAIQSVPLLPDRPARYDASRLADANDSWDILLSGAPPQNRSWRGRLRGFVWRVVGPPLETQRKFNASVVDHLNRNVRSHDESAHALGDLVATLKQQTDAIVRFESLLVQYLQTITGYIDTRDRSVGGSELRERLALTEQRLLALKRDFETRAAAGSTNVADGGPVKAAADKESPQDSTGNGPFEGALDSLTYVSFEDRFRGAADDIRERVRDYLPLFAGTSDVVDAGCGRGELLALLAERGIRARGVDSNAAMVEICRAKGFDVEQGDVLTYLRKQPAGAIGGLIAIQVVEHFSPAYLMRFLDAAFHAMRPGAPLILETLNPACWMAFFETYIRDITHRQPLHPDTLRLLVQASGFSAVDVQFRQPVREEDRLDRVENLASADPALARVIHAVNAHAEKLNARLFSSMDYVVIARR